MDDVVVLMSGVRRDCGVDRLSQLQGRFSLAVEAEPSCALVSCVCKGKACRFMRPAVFLRAWSDPKDKSYRGARITKPFDSADSLHLWLGSLSRDAFELLQEEIGVLSP